MLPAKKTPPILYKITKAAAAARSPPIEAFLLFYTGHGASTSEAVEDLFAKLPEEFTIDDEFAVKTASLEHTLQRPFQIVHSDMVRTFVLT